MTVNSCFGELSSHKTTFWSIHKIRTGYRVTSDIRSLKDRPLSGTKESFHNVGTMKK